MQPDRVWKKVYFSPWMDYHLMLWCKHHKMSRSAAIDFLVTNAWSEMQETFKPKPKQKRGSK